MENISQLEPKATPETPSPKVSPRKLEANRKNARKSTGPKTPRGKAISRLNALKHGFLAQEVLITKGAAKENPAEFQRLLSSLAEDPNPVGFLEKMLVEKIAMCYWRLRRVYRTEAGIIRSQVDATSTGATFKKMVEFDRAFFLLEMAPDREEFTARAENLPQWDLEERLVAHEQMLARFRKTIAGIELSRQLLLVAERQMQQTGQVGKVTERRLFACFGDVGLARCCCQLRLCIEEEKDPSAVQDGSSLEHFRRMVLAAIEMEKERLKDMEGEVEEQELLELSARKASLSLPQADDAKRILLYEDRIERELYRALDQLERLQRQRKGEIVPPPLKAELRVAG